MMMHFIYKELKKIMSVKAYLYVVQLQLMAICIDGKYSSVLLVLHALYCSGDGKETWKY